MAKKRGRPRKWTDEQVLDNARRASNEANREANTKGRDIPPPDPIVNPERRESCRYDLKRYLEIYHAEDFALSWSDDHLILISAVQQAILEYLRQIIAYPRGSGKTTILRRAVQWATNYGHVRYSMLFGAEASKARQHIDDIKRNYLTNERLLDDFPELAHPVRCSQGIGNRALHQTCRRHLTHMKWGEVVVMPTLDESVERGNAGIVINVGTITGSSARGQLVNGHRPDLALVDDPQTRRSAKSPGQIQERLDTINGDIVGMAGPNKSISVVCTATVIYKDDLADKLLNHQENPEWNGVRVAMVKAMPANMKAWEEWNDVRKACLLDDRSLDPCHKFYLERRAEMDLGSSVYWEDRITPGYESAIESAMSFYFQDPVAFASEYQNEPIDLYDSESAMPTIEELNTKRHSFRRRIAPEKATKLTAMIDVQKTVLYYWVCAWEENFTGYVLDYGTWPNQRREYFTLADVRNTIFRAKPGSTFHGALHHGLNECIEQIENEVWRTVDGNRLEIDVGLVDAQFGDSTETVYKVIRERGEMGKCAWIPSHGKGHSARVRPFSDIRKKPGDKIGPNWMIPNPMRTTRRQKHVIYETNFWKTWHAQHWALGLNEPGSISFFSKQGRHQLPAEHFHAERCIEVEANGRRVIEWMELPTARDNHFLDLSVGCCVAASIAGCEDRSLGDGQSRRKKRPKLTRESLGRKLSYAPN